MGTHPIFESDFDCLTDMRFTNILRGTGAQRMEKGQWNRIPGSLDSGKHILPPIIKESQRKEQIEELWREAKNEMWLVRHKYQETPEGLPQKASLSFEEEPTEST